MNCVNSDSAASLREWAASGLMMMTGPESIPLVASRDYPARIRQLLATLIDNAREWGGRLDISDAVLCERAALMDLARHGGVSAGGKTRLLRTADGHVALTLARPEDRELIPAWIGVGEGEGSWETIERCVARTASAMLEESGQVLGIPVAAVKLRPAEDVLPVRLYERGSGRPARRHGLRRARGRKLLVLDFSSLWAGPLCARIFGQLGARVIKIESRHRPDGARFGNADFFDRLHAGQEMLALNFKSPQAISWLRRLIARADVVIESSRPRAFTQLGLEPDDCFRDNPDLTWISITAYGRRGACSNYVGFGDDVAAAAGMLEWDESGNPCFVGDAIADPLAGIAGATGGLQSLLAGGGHLVDSPLLHAARFVAAAPPVEFAAGRPRVVLRRGAWWVEYGLHACEIRPPYSCKPLRHAAGIGAHTAALGKEFP